MTNTKRFLALLLTVIMSMAMFSFASAEGADMLGKETLENPNVTIAAYWAISDQVILDAIAEFEAKYGGKVTVNVVGWNKGANAIQEAMATGDMFDLVFTEGNARFPGDAVAELYQPIDQWLDYNAFDKASVDAFLYKGLKNPGKVRA